MSWDRFITPCLKSFDMAMLRWIWDLELVAVVGDMPSFEAYPCQN